MQDEAVFLWIQIFDIRGVSNARGLYCGNVFDRLCGIGQIAVL
jgi:hypothetical protein